MGSCVRGFGDFGASGLRGFGASGLQGFRASGASDRKGKGRDFISPFSLSNLRTQPPTPQSPEALTSQRPEAPSPRCPEAPVPDLPRSRIRNDLLRRLRLLRVLDVL